MTLTRADFASRQTVRWCSGCGDYAILASVQKVLPALGVKPASCVFVSGIGCSGRFPYYMGTYGLHTLHGRGPGFVTGLKLTRPDLSVWLVTGDGDALSIGANHLLHILRRNIDVNILLLNNSVYGLTKGQFSPTSSQGTITQTSPQGSLETPVHPVRFALSAGATFVARAVDTDAKHLQSVLMAAAQHRGTSIVEILQNCHVFNDGVYANYKDRFKKADHVLYLNQGEPMVFGEHEHKAIVTDRLALKIVECSSAEQAKAQALIYDEGDNALAVLLAEMNNEIFPMPLGIIRRVNKPCYDVQKQNQVSLPLGHSNQEKINQLLWE